MERTVLEESKTEEAPQIELKVIGIVQSIFKFKNGTPRQSNVCPSATGCLTIRSAIFNNPEHSLQGLSEYSHLWIIFFFHKNGGASTKAKIKPPRLGGEKVGVFASRSPHRPSPIGLSLAKIEKVEGAQIFLSGIDIIDETPVLDIKPYITAYDMPNSSRTMDQKRNETNSVNSDFITTANWLQEVHKNKLRVLFTPRAMSQLQSFGTNSTEFDYTLEHMDSWSKVQEAIESVLSNDPRSVYRKEQCQDKLYYFTIDKVHVTCWFDDCIAEVLRVQPTSFSHIENSPIF